MRRLQKIESDVDIVWRAFELRPEPVPMLDPKGEYLQQIWHGSVYPLAKRLKMVMKLPPIQPRSRRAHAAACWARQHGRFNDYNEAVFRAFFERGEDIGSVDALLRLAAGLGLEISGLRRALSADEYLDDVLADERTAAELGVSGVPAFIANRKAALSGVQSAESLKQLIDNVRSTV